MRSQGWVPWWDWYPFKTGKDPELTVHPEDAKTVAVCKPEGGPSPEPESASTLTSDLQPPGRRDTSTADARVRGLSQWRHELAGQQRVWTPAFGVCKVLRVP